jgi:sigma-E factor negative regulatory protein RseA
MTQRETELSALLDGELEPHEVDAALKMASEEAMLVRWNAYVLIGDSLRGESSSGYDLTPAIMAKIREEPVVLAPANLQRQRRHHPLLALAASVAGVAVVGWIALVGNSRDQHSEATLAAVPASGHFILPAPTFVRAPEKLQDATIKQVPLQVRGDMNEYLVAHNIQSSSFRLGEGTRHAQTVSMTSQP